jgi:hypothetical protein
LALSLLTLSGPAIGTTGIDSWDCPETPEKHLAIDD